MNGGEWCTGSAFLRTGLQGPGASVSTFNDQVGDGEEESKEAGEEQRTQDGEDLDGPAPSLGSGGRSGREDAVALIGQDGRPVPDGREKRGPPGLRRRPG